MTRSSRFLAVFACLAAPALAAAALKDVGPVDPVTGFPVWYRDTNGAALGLCAEQRPSPNASSGGAPMCFPIVPDPAGFPGNLGEENFYHQMSSIFAGNGINVSWEAALEAAYANGTPIRGDEMVFARIRIRIDTPVAGTYTVTHPYGVDVFPGAPAGVKGINFTSDIGIAPGVFTGALQGAMGPFLEWDQNVANPTSPFGIDPASGSAFQLAIGNADGSSVQFVGDPNILHTVTGSPFGVNKVRVDGPPGSNLDGQGNDFVESNLFAILGQRYLVPIPQPLAAPRSNVSVTAEGLAQVDVFARSVPGAQLVATADGVPTSLLTTDLVTGEAVGHVEFALAGPVGKQVTLTNITDSPHSVATGALTDYVSSSLAVFFPDTRAVTIIAETSVKVGAPALAVVELPGVVPSFDAATPWIQRFDGTIPAGSPIPWQLTVVSQMGGSHTEPVTLAPTAGRTPFGPVAANLAETTDEGVARTITVTVDPALSAMVLNPPANGTAVLDPAAPGTITYTPKNLFFGADSFTYLLVGADGSLSNKGTVAVTVNGVNNPPVANRDFASTAAGTPVIINLVANDTDSDSAIVPASVVLGEVTPAGAGIVQNIGNGTVNFQPLGAFTGSVTFTYTVSDNGTPPATSAPALVTVTVTGQAETLTITRADYISNKGRYRVDGSSSVFGPGLANRVTIRAGSAAGPVIGEATIGATGLFTMDVISPVVLDATNSAVATSSGGGTTTFTFRRR